MYSIISRPEPSHCGVHYGMTEQDRDVAVSSVAHCSVEEWEAGSLRVARVVVEIDATKVLFQQIMRPCCSPCI
jgi:hypothetical protein